jgi:hypothetical protein
MHGNYDDVFTLDWPDGVMAGTNMGTGLFISTAALLRSSPPDLSDASSNPHGTPTDGITVQLQAATDGGGPCP